MGHYMDTLKRKEAEQLADVEEHEITSALSSETAEVEGAMVDQAIADAMHELDERDLAETKRMAAIPQLDVGTRVVYIPRPGHSRMGRNAFPADILHVNPDDGSVELFVIMEAEDLVTESRVAMMRNEDDRHCWRPVNINDHDMHEPSRLNAMASRLVEVEDQLVVLKDQMFGEYTSPPKAVMEYLADFDARLRAMETAQVAAPAVPKGRKTRKA